MPSAIRLRRRYLLDDGVRALTMRVPDLWGSPTNVPDHGADRAAVTGGPEDPKARTPGTPRLCPARMSRGDSDGSKT